MPLPDILDRPICLTEPGRVAPSGWLEHVPFGMWIVDVLRPRLLVELGTHHGVSYCAFCQAAKELDLACSMFAVDTWEGDTQSGLYGREVLEDLRAYHDPLYGSFSTLLVSPFDDAVESFKDCAIDLLHIDGCHSYDAVRHDFTAWLPKLSDRGVILFHDSGVQDPGFGVWRLWQEVKGLGPSFEFTHGHGLGVLAPGAAPPAQLKPLTDASDGDIPVIRETFHQLGRRVSQTADIEELRRYVQSMESQVRRLAATESELQVERAHNADLQARVHDLEQRAAAAGRAASELRARLSERDDRIEDLRETIATWERHWTGTQRSLSWRLVMGIRDLRHALAPDDTLRGRLWLALRQGLRRPVAGVPSVRSERVMRRAGVPPQYSAPEDDSSTAGHIRAPDRQQSGSDLERVQRVELDAFLASSAALRFPQHAAPEASVVIPVWNNAHLTYGVLRSLLGTPSACQFEVILVDNGSTDATQRLAERLENVTHHRNDTNLGFGEACNAGARLARAPYVCFLNNDTIPTAGWLDELVQVMACYPGCGAAGAKLVLPDGTLQEAGSILWADGSAAGYGRGGDPLAPEFSYVREVDFCSANGLLVRKETFEGLGGFDSRYSPAYYEDADLCLSVWAQGLRVMYAPRSTILHLEHGTSSRHEAVRLQLRNRESFRQKWSAELSGRSMPGRVEEFRARDRRVGKRLLMVDDRVPVSRMGSGFPRTRALLQAFVDAGFVITFLPATNPRRAEPETSQLEALGVEVLCGEGDPMERLRGRDGLYEVVLVSRPHNAGLLRPLKSANPESTVIYDVEAIFTVREALMAEIQGSPMSAGEMEARIAAELAPVASADLVITVTEREREAIHLRHPTAAIQVWGHAIPVHESEADFDARRDVLFVGYLGSEPNRDAALYLITEIMPLVHAATGCRLRIVGDAAGHEIVAAARMAGDGVSLDGYVDDLSEVYRRARVFVAPHRFSAGLPLKVVEAMSYGVPCVVSQLLADQLSIPDSSSALVGSDPQGFAASISALLTDRALWSRVRDCAHEFVQKRFDPATMSHALRGWIEPGGRSDYET